MDLILLTPIPAFSSAKRTERTESTREELMNNENRMFYKPVTLFIAVRLKHKAGLSVMLWKRSCIVYEKCDSHKDGKYIPRVYMPKKRSHFIKEIQVTR